ncbi:hypothetical protein NADFUDRAFT_82704 [Nadsonia fulvescens var. elongata DSM 6958]|uniref:SUN-domain-containing protein n=1 Tax=Nadsonia fulvescens var. elongata DSM 6958 TaxID=857566 RepID=A0A1E3PKJ9_9ASCO|nr:hypothetical protein NADFUDRAFT_82704 [Nadsonia fulvescens var. elongata DSM 6958]
MVSALIPQLVALTLLASATSAHSTLKHKHHQHTNTIELVKRTETSSSDHHSFAREIQPEQQKKRSSKTCDFPTDAGLVSVTPNELNAGWAMSPDQPCTAGSWCPYACPPGQVSLQWDPKVTSYEYPGSQYGGLYCNENGEIEKPFSQKDYCADGSGAAVARNKCSKQVAFCQTVLPGNEAMLIPTNVEVGGSVTLAVPDPSYWASTAAHFYINPPGYDVETACVWGTNQNPYGNWSPYVAGANTDSNSNTFIKIGWNPIYLEETTPFRNKKPTFGIRIVCDDESQCNGLPCSIDPSTDGINGVTSSLSADGAGDGAFCVVTASNGAKAHIEVFDIDGSGSESNFKNKAVSGSKKLKDNTESFSSEESATSTLNSNVSTSTSPSLTSSSTSSSDTSSSSSNDTSSIASSDTSSDISTNTPSSASSNSLSSLLSSSSSSSPSSSPSSTSSSISSTTSSSIPSSTTSSTLSSILISSSSSTSSTSSFISESSSESTTSSKLPSSLVPASSSTPTSSSITTSFEASSSKATSSSIVSSSTIISSTASETSTVSSYEAEKSSLGPVSSRKAISSTSIQKGISKVSKISRSEGLANMHAVSATVKSALSSSAFDRAHGVSTVSSVNRPSAVYNLVISANVSIDTDTSSGISASTSTKKHNGANNLSISVTTILALVCLAFML